MIYWGSLFISDFVTNSSEITIVFTNGSCPPNCPQFLPKLYYEYWNFGGERSCESRVWRMTYYLYISFPILSCDSSTCIFTSSRIFFSLSFKKVIAHRRFKGSVIHTLVDIRLMLSAFLLNGAQTNSFEKVRVFTGEEKQAILEFITPTLGANIDALGQYKMGDPRYRR